MYPPPTKVTQGSLRGSPPDHKESCHSDTLTNHKYYNLIPTSAEHPVTATAPLLRAIKATLRVRALTYLSSCR